jgi:hypothetical protein
VIVAAVVIVVVVVVELKLGASVAIRTIIVIIG